MERIVIKIGGSILFLEDGSLNISLLRNYVTLFERLAKERKKLIIITGGGMIGKKYVSWARELGANEAICDLLGIQISRANAFLLISALGEIAYPDVPTSINDVIKALSTGRIVVLGGLQPGQSTNAVAALVAESIRADVLIIATDVDGVYDLPPQMPDAKKLDRISYEDLLDMVLKHSKFAAGKYELFDPLSVLIMMRSKIPVRVVNGKDPENIVKVIKGEKIGTLVCQK